jgi:hypothetical protein
MDDTTARAPGALTALLAGLQAGMLGVLWMLAWLGVSGAWQNQGFWTPENLFATAFYGSGALSNNFGLKTLPGLALYLLLYSLLGGAFALALRGRAHSGRLKLAGIIFALAWFYLSFHVIWKSAMPLVYLLYSDRPMMVGHLIFGLCVGRFPAHYPGRVRPLEPVAPEAEALELASPDANGQPESTESASQAPVGDPPVAPRE